MVPKQTECFRLEQRSVFKFLLRNSNNEKFTEECVICTEKHVLVKKNVYKWLNISLPLGALVKKTVYKIETYWLSSKEKILGIVVIKKVMLIVNWDVKGPTNIDFLKKEATVKKCIL